ncbi:hypothetical protein JW980_06355 [Acinetobacter johnsonii]|uniref:hypothetical protein n=1 Tax=Acinetobacter johnsonii TaxID=40214 RepID=UPI00196B9207|nr:hypothetical protein [Acinetobacter johnsonii]QSE46992.1 hypothetical protein JW980_06355 [Acinetobacter johnsonii]
MDLIEQLGGYDRAKKHKDYLIDFGNEFNRPNKYEVNKINNALLEYRRQHNIYEVGDAVVIRESLRYPAPNRLFKVYTKIKVYSDGSDSIYVSGSKGLVQMSTQYIRHATDEEIKAGKRLEVKSEN